jgi:hypothetical protein
MYIIMLYMIHTRLLSLSLSLCLSLARSLARVRARALSLSLFRSLSPPARGGSPRGARRRGTAHGAAAGQSHPTRPSYIEFTYYILDIAHLHYYIAHLHNNNICT